MSWDGQAYNRWSLDELQHRVQAMLLRGVATSVDDALKMQVMGLDLEDGLRATKVEHWHPYGFTTHPHGDAEVLLASLGGNRDHMIAIATADRRHRMKSFAAGEVALHDDQGQFVHMKRGGMHIKSPLPVTIEAPTITLKGNVVVQGDINQTGSITSSGSHTATGGHL